MISELRVERRVAPLGLDALRPRFAWRPEMTQVAYRLQVVDADDPHAVAWTVPIWDSGRQTSSQSTYVEYAGPALRARRRYRWRVQVFTTDADRGVWSEPSSFETGLLAPDDWSARWIAHLVPDQVSEPEEDPRFRPLALLRRHFVLAESPLRARLYITALGVYEAYLSGRRVEAEWLAPGWTDYHHRVQYQTFDVGDLLRAGDNALAVRLADGWYAGSIGPWGRQRYGDLPALLCQLEVQLPSGEVRRVESDRHWRCVDSGTWLHDLQSGERTDLRQEPRGWLEPDFDDRSWQSVSFRADPGARLIAARDDGVRLVDRLPARSVRAAAPHRFVVDFGVNAAGVIRLRIPAGGHAGQHIVTRHAEALDAHGELYIDNLRSAEQRDELILADNGPVVLEPHFTFHGFRYAEVSGPDRLEIEDVETLVLSSATRQVGWFDCSDPRINQLQANIITSLRANFISIPTDCPQRDERLGWAADLQIFASTALFNCDVTNMLLTWLDSMSDAQLPSGAYADVAPYPPGFVGWGNTAWSDAGVIVPWLLYQRSGDRGVLHRQYDSMRRYLTYLEADQTDGLRFGGRYGDWVSLGAHTDKLFIGTAYLAHMAELFARIAATLGHVDDEHHARALAGRVRAALLGRFVDANGQLTVDTQTAHAMALGFDLLPHELRAAAAGRLVELIEQADTHLATGFLGTPLVLPALSDTGHHELACRLLRQDTYPSWLYAVGNNATSIWERWNGWTPEQGFYPPLMNSLNHYAFGAVGDWMYRYVAGLDPVEPGYRRTLLRPRPGAGLTSANARHESLYGVHACGWRLEHDVLRIAVEVPPNTGATLELPPGTSFPNGSARIDVLPGRHSFAVAWSGLG